MGKLLQIREKPCRVGLIKHEAAGPRDMTEQDLRFVVSL